MSLGREELGAFRRMRPGSPRLGHSFTTIEDGAPVSWEVIEGAFGSVADESDPDRGHGWMCRLLDAGALGTAGSARVRKQEFEV